MLLTLSFRRESENVVIVERKSRGNYNYHYRHTKVKRRQQSSYNKSYFHAITIMIIYNNKNHYTKILTFIVQIFLLFKNAIMIIMITV